jgi:hypothetical protein
VLLALVLALSTPGIMLGQGIAFAGATGDASASPVRSPDAVFGAGENGFAGSVGLPGNNNLGASAPEPKEVTAVAADGSEIKLLLRGEDVAREYSLNNGLSWKPVPSEGIVLTDDGTRISLDGQGEADYYLKDGVVGGSGNPGDPDDPSSGADDADDAAGDSESGTDAGGSGSGTDGEGEDSVNGADDMPDVTQEDDEQAAFVQEREQTEGLTPLTADGVDSLTAEQALDAGWHYRVNADNESVTITDYRGGEMDLRIPSEIDGKAVIAIGEAAFSEEWDWGDGGSVIWQGRGWFNSITFPSSVRTIGQNAFRGVSVSEVTFANGLTSIGAYAFATDQNPDDPSSLMEGPMIGYLSLPASLQSIGSHAFANSSVGSEGIVFNGAAPDIGEYAFAGCQSFGHLTLPTSARIGQYAFANSSLTSVQFDGPRQLIEAYAFADAHELTSVSFPSVLQTIGDYAFAGTALRGNLSLPASCRTIGIFAFSNTGSLNGLELSGNILDVSIGAFAGSGISWLTLGEGINTIGSGAFADCVNLRELAIPSTVTVLGARQVITGGPTFRGAFAGCTALERLVIPGSVVQMSPSTLEDVPTTAIAYVESNSLAATLLSQRGNNCYVTASTPNYSIQISYPVFPYAESLPIDTVVSLDNLSEQSFPAAFVKKLSDGWTQVDVGFHLTLTSKGTAVTPQGPVSVALYPSPDARFVGTSGFYGLDPTSASSGAMPTYYNIWLGVSEDGKGRVFGWPLPKMLPSDLDRVWTGDFFFAHYGKPPVAPGDRRPSAEERQDEKGGMLLATDPGGRGADEFTRTSDPSFSSRDFLPAGATGQGRDPAADAADAVNIGESQTPLDPGEGEVGSQGGSGDGLAAGGITVRLAGMAVDVGLVLLALVAVAAIGIALFYFGRARRMHYEEERL